MEPSKQQIAIIIGAGPAGLTAAHELVTRTRIKPIVYEMSGDIGGISKTINHKGNRIDLGGHRFFSKSDRVMQWWENLLPLQGAPSADDLILGRDIPLSKKPGAPDPEETDRVMLVRNRISRIFFLRKFFEYPISLNRSTFSNLGPVRIVKIGLSYLRIRLFPIKKERSLEDFFINRFGRALYHTFFEDYTEKVWGEPCGSIGAEWGSQRIKGLSISKAIVEAFRNVIFSNRSFDQRDLETSLIKKFFYPKLGPGQLWEEVARIVKDRGGEVHLRHEVIGLDCQDDRIARVRVKGHETGALKLATGDYFFSTMPVKDMVRALGNDAPTEVHDVAEGLKYRDFITVGLLLTRLRVKNMTNMPTINNIVPDNWMYIQERDVKLGRVQIFNNWSPYLVKDKDKIWIGLEYFCSEGDELWTMPDDEFSEFAISELEMIGIIDRQSVLDKIVIRMPKTYPAYFGSYAGFHVIREFTDKIDNLFLIGRNGMHRYNNQDHSMLTAMTAVDNIINGVTSKNNLWAINTEDDYHEVQENI